MPQKTVVLKGAVLDERAIMALRNALYPIKRRDCLGKLSQYHRVWPLAGGFRVEWISVSRRGSGMTLVAIASPGRGGRHAAEITYFFERNLDAFYWFWVSMAGVLLISWLQGAISRHLLTLSGFSALCVIVTVMSWPLLFIRFLQKRDMDRLHRRIVRALGTM